MFGWFLNLLGSLVAAVVQQQVETATKRVRSAEAQLAFDLAKVLALPPNAVSIRMQNFEDGSVVSRIEFHTELTDVQWDVARSLTETWGTPRNTVRPKAAWN